MTQVFQSDPSPDREYKSRLFAMVFGQKKELLELYNAMNGTSYDNPELLEINTLKNAIYLAMHNDISFMINSRMSLYEHQSTYNPNIPLRFLEYTDRVRQYGKTLPIESAVERAITECIKEGILAEVLSRKRAEAKKVSIYEYDQEKHMRMEREENFEEGRNAGIIEGRREGKQENLISQVCKKLQKNYGISEIADMLEESEEEIQRICDIAKKYAPGYDVEKILREIQNDTQS